ncbi:hypothetical protein J6590_044533 [Homalodisca vitripennis]|nr:hypothetical protein J6590_044533 [Homalodisca vitripennis]
MRKYISLFAVFIFLHETQGVESGVEICPDSVRVQEDFSLHDYMGTWYGQASTENAIELAGRCNQDTFTYDHDKNEVHMTSQGITSPELKELTMFEITAVETDPNKKEGIFNVTINVPPYGEVIVPYWVLETDYNTYSIVYSCVNFYGFHQLRNINLFTRNQDIQDSSEMHRLFNRVEAVMAANNIHLPPLVSADQTNCHR